MKPLLAAISIPLLVILSNILPLFGQSATPDRTEITNTVGVSLIQERSSDNSKASFKILVNNVGKNDLRFLWSAMWQSGRITDLPEITSWHDGEAIRAIGLRLNSPDGHIYDLTSQANDVSSNDGMVTALLSRLLRTSNEIWLPLPVGASLSEHVELSSYKYSLNSTGLPQPLKLKTREYSLQVTFNERIASVMQWLSTTGIVAPGTIPVRFAHHSLTATPSAAPSLDTRIWGKASAGLQMSLEYGSNEERERMPRQFRITLRNVAAETLYIDLGANQNEQYYPLRIVLALADASGESHPFSPRRRPHMGIMGSFEVFLVPGAEYSLLMNWNDFTVPKDLPAGDYLLYAAFSANTPYLVPGPFFSPKTIIWNGVANSNPISIHVPAE